MTSRLRGALRAAGPPVLLALLLPAGFGTPTAYAAPPPPTAPYYGTGSLAGNRAGEGRLRPGREDPVAVPDPAVWRPLPPPPREVRRSERPRATPVEPGPADAPRERAAEGPAFPGLRVLPLGGGMVLIGLGLGFLALRLRRG
ncbi:hypothetical protein [Streptomyces flavofungini]|uniref:Uncharacterized protein n=1 Tax=Streptomyces flavofungini TaxID=68200 RepID=A0ABS0WY48_9ACTN|nr:hypothetical protein [Streptomyces flavofungini]MBJ3805841.1 hypothetical protein [Streptomyces flavofungini]GHC75618.1 hypothetical protein GCM10010349_54860 [Streptomyces flavofungini]